MLKEGDKAPDFKLQGNDNKVYSLNDFKGNLVLYFYPKDFTPGCTAEACGFRDFYDKIKKKAKVVGVSMDSVESHKKFAEKHSLQFLLLSDKDGKMCKDYGVLGKKSMFGKSFIGLKRTTFIIKDGKVVKVFENVNPSGHEKEILEFLN